MASALSPATIRCPESVQIGRPKAPCSAIVAIGWRSVVPYKRTDAGLKPEQITARILPSGEAAAPCGMVSVPLKIPCDGWISHPFGSTESPACATDLAAGNASSPTKAAMIAARVTRVIRTFTSHAGALRRHGALHFEDGPEERENPAVPSFC